MKTIIACVLFGCLSMFATAANTPTLKADNKPDVTAQLLKVERDMNEAFKAGDKDTLAVLCSEDFAATDDAGYLTNKTQFLKNVNKDVKVVSYTLHNLAVHVYGDTAIITGQWKGIVKTDNVEYKSALSFTDTFIRRNERWYAVASQMTRMEQGVAGA